VDRIVTLSEKILELLKEDAPILRECELHDGPINKVVIEGFRKSAPSFLLSQTSLSDLEAFDGGYRVRVKYIGLIAAKDGTYKGDRHKAGVLSLRLSLALGRGLQQWELGSGFGLAEQYEALELTDQDTRRHTGSVRIASWSHIVTILDEGEDSVLDDILVSWSPDIGPDHIEDYESVLSPGALP